MRAFWRRREDAWLRPMPPQVVALTAVAFVRNEIVKPQPHGWEDVTSILEFLPEHIDRLEGLEAYSHVIVVTYLDVAAGAPEKPQQLTLASGKRYGIFATRSQLRPNHLGVSVAALISREGERVTVRGLDAIDGTPVLDTKPYLPEYDSRPDARVP